MQLARQLTIFLRMLFLVETSHQLLWRHCLEFLGVSVEPIVRVTDRLSFLAVFHHVAVALNDVLDHTVERKLLVSRELRHSVVLLVKNGHIDMLVTYVSDFEGFLEEAAAAFGESNSARQLVFDHI